MQNLKVTLFQSALFWEDIAANLSAFEQKMEAISPGSTDVILLPEMFTTGFSMKNVANLAETAQGLTFEWLQKMANKHKAVVSGSFMVKENGKFYNRLLWMRPDGNFAHYDKKHLFSMAKEQEFFSPGTTKTLVDYNGWKICPMICYDLRFPTWLRNKQAYDLLYFVANWPESRSAHWRSLLQARAIENQAYVVGVNRVGKDGNGVPHSGDSMVIAPDGKIIAHLSQTEQIHQVSLAPESIEITRRHMPFLKDMD